MQPSTNLFKVGFGASFVSNSSHSSHLQNISLEISIFFQDPDLFKKNLPTKTSLTVSVNPLSAQACIVKFHAPVKNKFVKGAFKKGAFVACIEEACAAHDHIWMIGPRPVYGYYVKPRADRDQQTGPSAHVGICHTYLTKCVTCGVFGRGVSHPFLLFL